MNVGATVWSVCPKCSAKAFAGSEIDGSRVSVCTMCDWRAAVRDAAPISRRVNSAEVCEKHESRAKRLESWARRR